MPPDKSLKENTASAAAVRTRLKIPVIYQDLYLPPGLVDLNDGFPGAGGQWQIRGRADNGTGSFSAARQKVKIADND